MARRCRTCGKLVLAKKCPCEDRPTLLEDEHEAAAEDDAADEADEGDAPGEKACPKCAETVKRAAEVCRFCGYNFTSGRRDSPVSPGVAAVLAVFLPGAGHIYCGALANGILIMVAFLVMGAVGLGMLQLQPCIGLLGCLVQFGLWAFQIYDAHATANKLA